ncbi:PPC domain-containing DNA-binding protein [Halobacillus andaensis]|uniref:PPC domain-containing DNA-binding protein n=1 Tax=Halobacillus andaensis TaxID=1176239 RepID=UPI003D7531A5
MAKISGGVENNMRRSHSLRTNESGVIFGSLSKGMDLMEGILKECENHGIKSGYVSCIGSLKKAGYVLFKTIDGEPSGYGHDLTVNNPVELVNGNGFICEDENGMLDLHLHGIVVEENGKISAGHFVRGGNPTLITVEFSIIEGEDVKAKRTFHEELGFKVIDFSK